MAVPLPAPGRAERLGEDAVDQPVALAAAAHRHRAQPQVGTGEAADELAGVGGKAEAREDLVADHRGRGGGAREHGGPRQVGEQPADLEILRAEVVPPFADAMGLVHRHQRTREIPQQGAEAGKAEPLRRDVDEAKGARGERPHARAQLVRAERRGEVGGLDPSRGEGGDLVVHERHQRGNDEAGPRQQGGGQLIGEALAAPGGRDEEQAALGEQDLDGLALAGTEARVAKPGETGGQVERGGRAAPCTGTGLGHRARHQAISRTACSIRQGSVRGSSPTSRSRWGRRPC